MSGGRRGRREAADGGDGRCPPRRRTRDRAQLGAPLRPRPRWPQSGRPPPLHRDRLRSPRAHAAPGGRGRDARAGCRAGAGHAGGRHRGERGGRGRGSRPGPSPAAPGVRRRPGGPGGRSLAVPGASPEVRGLARAASRLDAEVLVDLLTNLLVERGAVATWDDVLCPVLVAAGLRWQRTGEGVDVEHVLSEATTEALRAHRAPSAAAGAGAPGAAGVRPGGRARAAAARRGGGPRGAARAGAAARSRVPPNALASAARRTGASAVFVWRQRVEGPAADLAGLPRSRPPVLAVVGGPGWRPGETPPGARLAADLRSCRGPAAGRPPLTHRPHRICASWVGAPDPA